MPERPFMDWETVRSREIHWGTMRLTDEAAVDKSLLEAVPRLLGGSKGAADLPGPWLERLSTNCPMAAGLLCQQQVLRSYLSGRKLHIPGGAACPLRDLKPCTPKVARLGNNEREPSSTGTKQAGPPH